MNGIRVSEKHGVNPSMAICFWCGKETGDIALLGKLPGDKEAPRHTVINYAPCDQCQKDWDQGVPILEVSMTPLFDKQPPFGNAYPTGRLAVVIQSAMNEPEKFPVGRPVFMEQKEFQNFLDNFSGQEKE